jgi:hypothetical protein
MSNASPKIPSPENNYKAPQGMFLGHAEWDATLGSIGARLRSLEDKRVELQETIDALNEQALGLVSETISAEITAQRAVLTQLQIELEAVQTAYEEIQSGGVFADTIRLRAPITGMTATVVQAALAELQGRFNAQRRINGAAIFLGAS